MWVKRQNYLTERKVYLTKKGHDHICKGGPGSRWKYPEKEKKHRDKWINQQRDKWEIRQKYMWMKTER